MSAANRELELPEAQLDSKVVRGKVGWLFLHYDVNSIVDQHLGRLQFSEQQLRQWRGLLETRTAWLERRGIPYYFLVSPNPHSVYADKLPDLGEPVGERPIFQLLRELDEASSFARLIYPIEQLVARKDDGVYSQTSTHWSALGAFVAYDALMEELTPTLPARRLSESDIMWTRHVAPGDLGKKLTPEETSVRVFGNPIRPRARLVFDNRVVRNGRRVEYVCPDAPDVSCMILGDSFCYMLVPFAAESFRHLIFGHISTLDYSLVEREKPDVVVSLMNERFLIEIPFDLPAPSLADLEAVKRADGDVYEPRAESAATHIDSPAEQDRVYLEASPGAAASGKGT